MGVRVEDEGKSESRLVARRIGIELSGNITPRESGQTSLWSFFTRELGKPPKETKQMTAVATQAGAVSHEPMGWHAIDWQKVHQIVRRLQARIVKATQQGRWGKVKVLQHLLTHSFSGKALAVRRVTENQGKRTTGVDRVVWDTPEKKAKAIKALRQRGYQALPLRRVNIPKSNGKMRPLGIPCMKDRAMQALYLLALDPIAEATADRNSYGFRLERSTADAIEQCRLALCRGKSAPWVLEGDIKACFDGISHDWLMTHIPMDKVILQKWLKAGFIEKDVFHLTEAGTPQGGIASPVLANLTLDGMEQMLEEHFPHIKTKLAGMVNFVRFADDFIITGRTKELLENEVKPFVEKFLRERGLELSQEKTRITHIEDGFDFLGVNIRKYKGKFLAKPSKKNVKTFLDKVREIIEGNKQATTGNLIALLNPVIRGWATYHRAWASKKTFNRVDHAIFKVLWRWAVRRHPHKSRHWVKAKYFHSMEGRNWVFAGELEGKDGASRSINLFSASYMPIRRHTKIKASANPYDPAWEVYFEERSGVQMEANLRGRRKLLYLWIEQDGLCPICNQKITKLTGWHNHHIVWRSHGGQDGMRNRMLLHPNCHRQVHSQGIEVVKPRPARGERKA